ncbi:chymotrypsin-2-like isoform X2 [Microplitis mediator]|uniref:chymotrypsin-2-like isoform X2 n=1 Tax=Microplitis mediator TaxID=375433 RepID=UPI002552F7BA|nr:chymotrypsin-2-like isoform X2 [Microplitis mediator]
MFTKSIISVLTLALVFASFQDVYGKSPNKITGGVRAFLYEFPSIVSIRFYGQQLCAGVFITTKHVLTAAHCLAEDNYFQTGVDLYPASEITIGSGSDNCYFPKVIHKIKGFRIHPRYLGSYNRNINDIAIITLEKPIIPNPLQQIIRLPSVHTGVGLQSAVAGWGTSYEGEGKPSELLKKAFVRTISNAECQRRNHVFIYSGQLCCSQNYGVGFCDGDSGGPLVHGGEVIGIVSMSFNCGKGTPDVYTRVHSYLPWIRANIQ